MDTYSPNELYVTVAEELFVSRNKAKATGGRNNIRTRGDGAEQTVRKLIGSLVGGLYRVTQGHVVRADGMKSEQMDIIVVKDVPAATMHKMDVVQPRRDAHRRTDRPVSAAIPVGARAAGATTAAHGRYGILPSWQVGRGRGAVR